MGSSKPGLFAREATGLVREIGFGLGVMIILCHVIGLGWQRRVFQFSGPKPMPTDMMPLGLPAMFWAFLIGGIIVLITGYAAGYVAAAMPRSGGGYVTISRVIHPIVGYMGGWVMYLAEAFSYGLIGVDVMWAISVFYGIAAAPNSLSLDSSVMFLGGIAIVWVFAILALLGTRMYGRILQVMFYIPLAITVLFFAMWIAGAMNPSVVETGIQDALGAAPQTFNTLAVNTGMTANPAGFFDAFSFALPGAFWAYMGWYATTFLAGEVKEANKKLPMVLLTSGIVIVLVYLASSSLAAIATLNVGKFTAGGHQWSFFQSYGWLSNYKDTGLTAAQITARNTAIPGFVEAWSTGIASFTARAMGLGAISWLIAIGAVFWLANDIPPFLLVASRTFFAMSFDRMMPERFAYVSERWHAPVWSIIVTGIFAIPACMTEAGFPSWASEYLKFAGVVATDIFDALFLTLFCVSCMLLPLERKDIFDRAAVKHSVGFVVLLGFVATLGGSFCLYIFIQQSPWIWSLFVTGAKTGDVISAVNLIGVVLAGLLLYIWFMYRNSTKGVDMRTLYLSIPPE